MGAPQIEQFLTDLAANGHEAASTQNQAFHALLFLYQAGQLVCRSKNCAAAVPRACFSQFREGLAKGKVRLGAAQVKPNRLLSAGLAAHGVIALS
jgi:hypothetical protein